MGSEAPGFQARGHLATDGRAASQSPSLEQLLKDPRPEQLEIVDILVLLLYVYARLSITNRMAEAHAFGDQINS